MARFLGELLFEIAWTFIAGWINWLFQQISQKVLSWLDTKFKGRAALVVGLLVGLAAAGFFPMMALLLAH